MEDRMTEAQAWRVLEIVRSGQKVGSVTLHPYSGAATLRDRWERSANTVAIINQDGSIGYYAGRPAEACVYQRTSERS